MGAGRLVSQDLWDSGWLRMGRGAPPAPEGLQVQGSLVPVPQMASSCRGSSA